ncbi:DUF4124 domain-containing protein [Ottowia sp.]|uniref:DUF4124 domain-containing protein n=1 Tax=Ottowia sp. TaxID=1898956 RepID=UPI003A848176
MKHCTLFFAATLVALPAAAQVYKCPDASGRTVIQQMPCAGGAELDVRPASGRAPVPAAATAASGAANAAPAMTEAERINAATDASARKRRMQDLQEREVPRARSAMYAHRDACKKQIADLDAGQYKYRQNLYGKTHAAQVASEKAAVSAQCDTKDRELKTNFDALLAECRSLGGCASITP